MKKILNILCILSCLAFSGDLLAAEVQFKNLPQNLQKSCSEIEVSPDIIFETSYGNLNYDFTKSKRELTEISERYGISEGGMFTSGLATIHVSWEITLGTVSRIIGNDNICIVPVSVNLFIGYTNPMIYISKDLKVNTCEYNMVIRHEQTHQQINKTALDYFIPRLKDAAVKISKDVKPIHISQIEDINKATNILTEEYIKRIEPMVADFKQEIMKEQAKLDNESHYRLEGNVCKKFKNKLEF